MSTDRTRRRVAVLLATLLVGSAVTLSSGQPAAADHGCNVAPWPAFDRIAPTARRIIVGTVTESLFDIRDIRDANVRAYPLTDPSPSFRLRVDEVLRGSAPESITVKRLRSGLPRRDPRRECGLLEARVGDRIVIAFDGKLPARKRRIDTVAWIEGDPFVSGQTAERLTLARVRQLAGHEPDGSSLPADRGIRRPPVSLASLPVVVNGAMADGLRSLGDIQARESCSSSLGQLPGLQVTPAPILVAAYRMDGQELATYAERLWSHGPLVERVSDGYSIPLELCIVDGFTSSGSRRMLVLIGADEPPSWAVAVCDKNEIPLDYDRPDPSPWPQATETWC